MSVELETPHWNPKWRRRKKHTSEGMDATLQLQLDAFRPQVDTGLFCKQERKWIKWKDISFTYPDADTRECWCSCGSLIKEEPLR